MEFLRHMSRAFESFKWPNNWRFIFCRDDCWQLEVVVAAAVVLVEYYIRCLHVGGACVSSSIQDHRLNLDNQQYNPNHHPHVPPPLVLLLWTHVCWRAPLAPEPYTHWAVVLLLEVVFIVIVEAVEVFA